MPADAMPALDPEIDRVEQNDRSAAVFARLDDQLDFRRIFQLGSTRVNCDRLDRLGRQAYTEGEGSRGGRTPEGSSGGAKGDGAFDAVLCVHRQEGSARRATSR